MHLLFVPYVSINFDEEVLTQIFYVISPYDFDVF